MPRPVTVGVCTTGRASLAACLASLEGQTLAPALVVVADNGEVPTAEATIGATTLPIAWRHAPARNVSVARNACLEAAGTGLLAFIDDDEVAPPGWLEALSRALTPGLAAVFGPTRGVYGEDAPAWMREARLHDQTVPENRGALRTGHSGNCLIDLSHPAMGELRFDPRFGRTGGEDTDYFHRAYAAGARYAAAPDAWVFEPVPPERARLGWLLRRKMRAGQTYHVTSPDGRACRARRLLAAPAKVAFCAAGAAATGDPALRARRMMRAALHLGTLRQALGIGPQQHYGRDDAHPDARRC